MDNLNYLDHIPSSIQNGDIPIYYNPDYLKGVNSEIKSFCAIRKNDFKLVLMIHFQVESRKANSLKDAPFGGLICNEPIPQNTIRAFLEYVIDQLKQQGVSHLIIKTAPPIYDSAEFIDGSHFLSLKFTKLTTDINHHIPINKNELADHVSPMQKRRLKKCMDAKFKTVSERPNQLETVFQFISECRKGKNHSLSVTLKKLKAAFTAFPERYLIFCCYDNETLVAATICVVVNSKVLYNFLPASALDYNSFSPMVFLISHIYWFCKDNQFDILDLGTSMLDNQPNDKLIAFKKRIGGIQAERYLYELNL